jgi:diamine N-acetyltransferase
MYLENDILKLRAPEPEDLEFFYRWENDTSLWVAGDARQPFSRYVLKRFIASTKDVFATKQARFTIVKKTDGEEAIGVADLFNFDPLNRRAAIGMLIDDKHRKHGFAAEALELLCSYALDFLKLHQLYAHVPESNTASRLMLERCGFTLIATLPDWIQTNNGYENVLFLTRLKI